MPSECEVCFVLEGDIEVVVEDETFTLGPGDALTFGAAVPHTWRTAGAARILWILAPGLPDPRKEVALTPRFTPPDAGAAPALHRHPHVRARAARHLGGGRRRRRRSACRSTPRRRCAPARASARPGSATPRCCCGPGTPAQEVDVFGALSLADLGDLETTPGNAERTAAQIAEGLEPVIRAGAVPVTLGGDHSIVLGELRAHAAVHGPVAVVLLDAHADTWEQYYGERYFHGTPFKRALEEGLIDPHRSLLAGMRGSLYAASDLDEPREWGFEIVPCDELRTWTRGRVRGAGRERVGDGPSVPLVRHRRASTRRSRPPPARPRSAACSRTRRSRSCGRCAGMRFTGFDLVEVAPAYDTNAQTTALLAANIVYEFLTLIALTNPAPSGG